MYAPQLCLFSHGREGSLCKLPKRFSDCYTQLYLYFVRRCSQVVHYPSAGQYNLVITNWLYCPFIHCSPPYLSNACILSERAFPSNGMCSHITTSNIFSSWPTTLCQRLSVPCKPPGACSSFPDEGWMIQSKNLILLPAFSAHSCYRLCQFMFSGCRCQNGIRSARDL